METEKIQTFNRTIVELKPTKASTAAQAASTFNRTIVELKLYIERDNRHIRGIF